MTGDPLTWLADALVVVGLVLMTLAVIGVARLPDIYTKLHAGSKATSLGIVLIALATIATRDPSIYLRALLAAAFVLLTAQVATYAIARAAADSGEPLASAERVDESDLGLIVEDGGPERSG